MDSNLNNVDFRYNFLPLYLFALLIDQKAFCFIDRLNEAEDSFYLCLWKIEIPWNFNQVVKLETIFDSVHASWWASIPYAFILVLSLRRTSLTLSQIHQNFRRGQIMKSF